MGIFQLESIKRYYLLKLINDSSFSCPKVEDRIAKILPTAFTKKTFREPITSVTESQDMDIEEDSSSIQVSQQEENQNDNNTISTNSSLSEETQLNITCEDLENHVNIKAYVEISDTYHDLKNGIIFAFGFGDRKSKLIKFSDFSAVINKHSETLNTDKLFGLTLRLSENLFKICISSLSKVYSNLPLKLFKQVMDVSEERLIMRRETLGLDFEIKDEKIIFPALPTVQKKKINLDSLKA